MVVQREPSEAMNGQGRGTVVRHVVAPFGGTLAQFRRVFTPLTGLATAGRGWIGSMGSGGHDAGHKSSIAAPPRHDRLAARFAQTSRAWPSRTAHECDGAGDA